MMTRSRNRFFPLGSLLASSLFLATSSEVFGELVAYWDFDDPASVGGASIDTRGGQAARLLGGAAFTPDAEGRSNVAGDKAIRFGAGAERLQVVSDFFTTHFSGNEATVSFWIKHTAFKASTAVSFVAPGGLSRAFQAHAPWSDGNVYFDTGGSTGAANRSSGALGLTAGTWHHIALVRENNAGATNKRVYRDGVEVATGVNDATIAMTINRLIIGNGPSTGESVNGDMDEIAVFDVALTPTEVADLASSTTSPTDYQTAATDSDSDGLPDLWETSFFPGDLAELTATGDSDGDGLDDIDELAWGTNPNDDDSDNDGLLDGAEITAGADPMDPDSDDDGLLDGVESGSGVFVSAADTGTDPTVADSDGDFADDGVELAYGTDPADINFRPTLLAYWDFNDDSVTTSSTDVRGGRAGNFAVTAAYSADAEGITGLAGDKAFSPSGGTLQSPNATWLNMATNQDQMTVMFWQKQTQVQSNTYLMNSPASAGGRGQQVHAPWSNGQIYFDNGGTGAGQRINKDSGVTWSNNDWHHFAFVKNGGTMEIYLDGTLFHSGTGANAMNTDFNNLSIGGGVTGVVDDFAVYSVGLTAQDVLDAYNLTKTPLELEDADMDGLPDSWEYSFYPADLTVLSGTGNLDGDGLTDAEEYALGTDPDDMDSDDDGLDDEIENGSGTWVSTTNTGTDPLVADTDGDGFRDDIENNSGIYNSQTDPGTNPNLADTDNDGFSDTVEGPNGFNPSNAVEFPVFQDGRYLMAYWKFDDASTPAQTVDEVNNHTGVVTGTFTAEGEGSSGSGTDRAVCFDAGQNVLTDGAFANLASPGNSMTVSFWQKIDSAGASAFWFTSPGSPSSQRGFQAHSPHPTGIIYFDHSGCCTIGQTRIQSGDVTASGTGEVVLGQWQHFAYVKDGNTKNVYVDGNLVLTGAGTTPLADDFANIYIGSTEGSVSMDGCIDEFSVFAGALSEVQVGLLASGMETPDTVLDASAIYDEWALASGLTSGVNDGPTQNPDLDALNNLLEFAFGTDPTVSNSNGVTWDGQNPAVAGNPVVELDYPVGGGVDLTARFMRRKDHGTPSSVSYVWEFSSDMAVWESSDGSPTWFVAPTDIADDSSGDYDLVEVPYPLILDNGRKARFFRVRVSQQ